MKNLVILGMVGISVCVATLVNTCPIAIENDTKYPVQIHTNDKSKSQFMLAPGQKETFGQKGLHAEFSLLEKNPNMRAESIIELRQHACSGSPDPVALKASDLLAGKFEEAFFKMDKTKNDTEDNSAKIAG